MSEIIKYELPDAELVASGLDKLKAYQKVVQDQLIKDVDFGIIPGTKKPSLLKPGAEKLVKIHGLADEYEVLEQIENWDKPFFHYSIKCKLRHFQSGQVVSEGIGSCNSMENKYRWRWVYENEIPPSMDKENLPKNQYNKYRIPNDDIYTQVNTIQKMAKKRALVDATLSACRLSAVFTQDIEDMNIEKNNNKTTGKKAMTPAQTKLWAKLVEVYKDSKIIKAELIKRTTFKGKDGAEVKGKDSIYAVSDKQADVVRHQIENEQPKIPEVDEKDRDKCMYCKERNICERDPAPDCGFYEPLDNTLIPEVEYYGDNQ